jgi:hypothetical protein
LVNAGVSLFIHTAGAPPPIAATVGVGFTVTTVAADVALHPLASVIVTVYEPAAVTVSVEPVCPDIGDPPTFHW